MDINHLEFLAKNTENYQFLRECLCNPYVTSCGSLPAGTFSESFHNLKRTLSVSPLIEQLLEMHIITEYLCFRDQRPEWFGPWIKQHIDLNGYFPEIEWKNAADFLWQPVPVFLVLDNSFLRHFIVGLIISGGFDKLWPGWADTLLDEMSKIAIKKAATAASNTFTIPENHSFYCYPLTLANLTEQFTGDSLGLPIALGFAKTLTIQNMIKDIAASGVIDRNGAVSKIGHLNKKVEYAGKKSFRVFLYPSQNNPPPMIEFIDVLPVSTIEEAWMFTSLYTPGSGHDLMLLSKMLKDPQTFVDNCLGVDCLWLKWVHQQGKLSHIFFQIFSCPDLFETTADKFEKCIKLGDLERGEMLASFISPETLQSAKNTSPLSRFRWCSLNLSLANHRGNVSEAKKWSKAAELLIKHAKQSDINAYANYFNRKYIIKHNRYQFDPTLPENLWNLLNRLEKRYKLVIDDFGSSTDNILGRLYGSLSQNYGFCGPNFLSDTIKYAELAQDAFGNGIVQELKSDWLRQFNYMAYAYLDAGNLARAEQSLLSYLEIKRWADLWQLLPKLDPYHHAALSRFFADATDSKNKARYFNWAISKKNELIRKRHPWQLWTYNLAKIAGSLVDNKRASELYSHSLDLCLAGKDGPTVQAMALLPLSGLWELDELPDKTIESAEKIAHSAAMSLNPYYFKILDQNDFRDVLEKVWHQPDVLFPFTYH